MNVILSRKGSMRRIVSRFMFFTEIRIVSFRDLHFSAKQE